MDEFNVEESVLKREKYFSQFRLRHQKELDTFEPELFKIENKNILEHLLTAGALGEIMCDLLGVAGQDKEDVVSTLILHDRNKLKEKVFLNETAKDHEPSYVDLEKFKKQEADELRKFGFSERVINLTDEIITHEDGGPKNIPEQIVFLVDAELISSEVVDVRTRFYLTNMGWSGQKEEFDEDLKNRNQKYSTSFFKGAPGHNDRPHFEVQRETAETICKKFYEILKTTQTDIDSPKYKHLETETYKLPYYFEDKLKERINS